MQRVGVIQRLIHPPIDVGMLIIRKLKQLESRRLPLQVPFSYVVSIQSLQNGCFQVAELLTFKSTSSERQGKRQRGQARGIYLLPCTMTEKAMAPHSSTFAQKIPWTEEPGRLQSMGSLELDRTERLHFHFSLSCIGEGNGNPLQCSCLENPRDWEAWWAAISGVAQSRTRLKRLSSSSSMVVFKQIQDSGGVRVSVLNIKPRIQL